MDLTNQTFELSPSFIAIERLGQGSYGDVYKVQDAVTKAVHAVKIIKQAFTTEGIPTNALREITLLKKMRHPNVINLKQVHISKKRIELCLDYCSFDLRKFKEQFHKEEALYNEQTILNIMHQVLKGMDYLHARMIMHRDLKLQNILLDYTDQTAQVRIADFGLSRKFTVPTKQYTREVSTLWYRAPELLLGNSSYSIGLDIWSIGCIFAEMFLSGPLFTGESEVDQLTKIFKVCGTDDYDALIRGNPTKVNYPLFRKTQAMGVSAFMSEKKIISWSKPTLTLIEAMLQVDPMKRITCKEALKHVSTICLPLGMLFKRKDCE